MFHVIKWILPKPFQMKSTYPYASESQHACNPAKTMSTLQDMLAVSVHVMHSHSVQLGPQVH